MLHIAVLAGLGRRHCKDKWQLVLQSVCAAGAAGALRRVATSSFLCTLVTLYMAGCTWQLTRLLLRID